MDLHLLLDFGAFGLIVASRSLDVLDVALELLARLDLQSVDSHGETYT